jgi:uncharacterized protein
LPLPAGIVSEGKDGLYLQVHAQPGAKQAALRGLHGDAVKVAVKEVAQDGKANAAIAAFVAKELGFSKSSVEVASGHTSRSKRLFIHGNAEEIRQRLESWLS